MNKTKASMLHNIGELTEEELRENYEISAESNMLTRSMEAEAQLLQAFIEMIRRIKDLSWMLKPTEYPTSSPSYGLDMKNLIGSKVTMAVTRQKLKKIIDEKMPILHKVIGDIFGQEEKESHSSDHEEEEECEDCE